MKWLALSAALAGPAQAALRFGCSSLSVQRLDPIVEPGIIPSGHVHQIVGGNAFNATMDPNDDPAERATCTTCVFTEDKSNYWTAVMYFKHKNGTYERVPQYANAFLGQTTEGMTVYYTQHSFSDNRLSQKITAFPKGFRMTVGSPSTNDLATVRANPGLRYTCLQTVMTRFPEEPAFPSRKCPAGIMAIHHFPACWDGKNLDSPNHQDHMYNTNVGAFTPARACPASHPVRVPQVAYETMWDTSKFANMWDEADGNPFTWSYDDDRGYGTHADYLFGWEGDSLQRVMDHNCFFQACGQDMGGPLKVQGGAGQNSCKVQPTVNEAVDGWLPHLPGRETT